MKDRFISSKGRKYEGPAWNGGESEVARQPLLLYYLKWNMSSNIDRKVWFCFLNVMHRTVSSLSWLYSILIGRVSKIPRINRSAVSPVLHCRHLPRRWIHSVESQHTWWVRFVLFCYPQALAAPQPVLWAGLLIFWKKPKHDSIQRRWEVIPCCSNVHSAAKETGSLPCQQHPEEPPCLPPPPWPPWTRRKRAYAP